MDNYRHYSFGQYIIHGVESGGRHFDTRPCHLGSRLGESRVEISGEVSSQHASRSSELAVKSMVLLPCKSGLASLYIPLKCVKKCGDKDIRSA